MRKLLALFELNLGSTLLSPIFLLHLGCVVLRQIWKEALVSCDILVK